MCVCYEDVVSEKGVLLMFCEFVFHVVTVCKLYIKNKSTNKEKESVYRND